MNEYLMHKLKERHAEEKADEEIYRKLSEEAEASGCHRLAEFLIAIANDEHTHKEFLAEYLEGYDDDDHAHAHHEMHREKEEKNKAPLSLTRDLRT